MAAIVVAASNLKEQEQQQNLKHINYIDANSTQT